MGQAFNVLILKTFAIFQGVLPNPLFGLFQQYLVQIKKAGSQVKAILSFTYLWYLFITEFYYAYRGSYLDENTNKTYYCATIILHPRIFSPFISQSQVWLKYIIFLVRGGGCDVQTPCSCKFTP